MYLPERQSWRDIPADEAAGWQSQQVPGGSKGAGPAAAHGSLFPEPGQDQDTRAWQEPRERLATAPAHIYPVLRHDQEIRPRQGPRCETDDLLSQGVPGISSGLGPTAATPSAYAEPSRPDVGRYDRYPGQSPLEEPPGHDLLSASHEHDEIRSD